MSINKRGKVKDMGLKDEIVEEVVDIKKEMEAEQQKPAELRQGLVDILQSKIVSRKLLVWVTATVLLATAHITPDEWTAITLGYVGVEGFADMAVKWKRG